MTGDGPHIDNPPPIVFVVDDDASVCKALARLLRSAGFDVETFATPMEFLDREPWDRASCLVLDVQMPGLSGLDLQEQLTQRGLDMAIVFISGHATVPISIQAMKSGAIDFLQKPFPEQRILTAVRDAIVTDDRRRRETAVRSELESRRETLTDREREVFELVVSGLLNKQVAARLGTSEKTVKVHRGRVMRKMEAGSLAELTVMAVELGVTSPHPAIASARGRG